MQISVIFKSFLITGQEILKQKNNFLFCFGGVEQFSMRQLKFGFSLGFRRKEKWTVSFLLLFVFLFFGSVTIKYLFEN
jgi:hypothetical protein